MHVRTERSGLSCVLTIGPGLRAETPSALEVTSHLESQRISPGLIDQDAIDALIKEAEADPGSEHEAVVAQGRPAIDGSGPRRVSRSPNPRRQGAQPLPPASLGVAAIANRRTHAISVH